MKFALVSSCLLAIASQVMCVDLPKPTLSGYLPTGSEESGELFYMFYKAQNKVPHIVDDTPILIWLNGGPGCSSMIGNFYEVGPQRVNEEGVLIDFDFTWNKNYAIMFIDQPVGTGLSQGRGTPKNPRALVQSLYNALNAFFTANPVYKSRPVFLTGESYAGHYIPALAAHVVEMTKKSRDYKEQKHVLDAITKQHKQHMLIQEALEKAKIPGGMLEPERYLDLVPELEKGTEVAAEAPAFRLAGVAIGSGLTEPRAQVQTHADVMYALGLLDEVQRAHARSMQDRVVRYIDMGLYEDATEARNALLDYLEKQTGVATLLDVRRDVPYHDMWAAGYLSTPEVRTAIGAKPGTMEACNRTLPEILTADVTQGYRREIATILDEIPVLLFQGQFDVKDGYASNLEWIKTLEWRDAEAFQNAERKVWSINDKRVGYWKEFGKLTHVMVMNAGHMVPHDAPEASFNMIETFVQGALDQLYPKW